MVEGKIESISIRDSSSRPPSIINTVPARPGELLNLRDLEQGVEQFNRLMSNNATLDIAPGDEPGTSKVIINNDSGKRWRVAGVYDNSGSESTGQYQAGVNISVDNLFALNDFLIFGHRQALPGERSREYSSSDFVSFILPYGYSTFSFNYSRSDYLSMLALASGNELESRGDTHTTGLSLERVLYRDQDSRISVAGAWTGKDSRNYLGGEYLGVSSRKLSVLDLDINASTFLWGASWSATLGLAKGLDNAGALEDVDGLPEVAPRAQFNKLKYGLNYFLPFAVGERDFTFSAQLTGQHADSVLYGSEQMLIGGTSTVRGFVDNILSGDHGYYLRNELSTHDIINIHDQSLILRTYVGLDYGETRGYANDDQDGYLLGSSIGGGINWSGLNIDLSYDQPLAQSRDLPLESGQFWFRVGATY